MEFSGIGSHSLSRRRKPCLLFLDGYVIIVLDWSKSEPKIE